jgi:hypothetical protein
MKSRKGSDDMTDDYLDARGIPTSVCPKCGSDWLMAPIRLHPDSYTIAMWGTKGFCYSCKTKVTIGTPPDAIDEWAERIDNEGETDDN